MAKTILPAQEKLTSEELLSKLFHAKAFTSEVKTAEDNARSLVVKISSINPDRSNDIVEPKGADLTNFLKNPVVLLSHNYQSLPIAKCIDIQITDDSIIAKVLFPDAGIYDVADTVFEMCKQGFMNAWSIGFIPTEYTERKDDNGWGYTFTKWQLLEFSAVSVPDNQDAVTIMRSKGINVDALNHEQKIEDAEAAVKTLEVEEGIGKEVIAMTIADAEIQIKALEAELIELKSGRTISKKNESLLKTAVEALTEVLKALDEIPAEEEEAVTLEPEKAIEPEVIEEKTIEPTTEFLIKLASSLKKTDKEVGLTLRMLKSLSSNIATKGIHSEGERI